MLVNSVFLFVVFEPNTVTQGNSAWEKKMVQLQTSYNNLTKELDQLQTSYNNMTKELDQLQTRYNYLAEEQDQLKKERNDIQRKLQGNYLFLHSCWHNLITQIKSNGQIVLIFFEDNHIGWTSTYVLPRR